MSIGKREGTLRTHMGLTRGRFSLLGSSSLKPFANDVKEEFQCIAKFTSL